MIKDITKRLIEIIDILVWGFALAALLVNVKFEIFGIYVKTKTDISYDWLFFILVGVLATGFFYSAIKVLVPPIYQKLPKL